MPKSCITPPFQSPPSISSNHTSASQNDDASIWFCHQHRKAILSEAGFFAEKGSTVWIEFNDWIPPELTDETQALLRFEMEAGLGLERHPDQAGYVYVYEHREGQAAGSHRTFKIGYSKNVVGRLDEWARRGFLYDLMSAVQEGERRAT